jgi:hypothetical protein
MYTLVAKIKPGMAETIRKDFRAATEASGKVGAASDILGILHFERFFIIDDTYLAFCSEFDGDMESYLNDFFAMELTPGPSFGNHNFAFQHTEGWPGASDKDAFVAFWLRNKVPEILNYSYYPGVTCKEIRKAVQLQKAFQSVLDRPDAAEALAHPALKALLAEASE